MARRKTSLNESIRPLLHPRYWATWCGVGIAWTLSYLPLKVQRFAGKALGLVFHSFAKRRRHIADVNLQICYPDMNLEERKTLIKEHFKSMGQGIFETFSSWFQPPEKLVKLASFNDQALVKDLLDRGTGGILIGGHFSSLDLSGTIISQHLPLHPMYKLQSNPIINWVMEHRRQAVYEKTIEKSNIRDAIKSLKSNHFIWYAVDQDYGRQHSVFAPFFGRDCATISHVGRLIKLTKAPVVAIDYARTENGYELSLIEVKDFPANNDEAGAAVMNKLMEEFIAPKKEQYFWTHRRFKTPPVEGDSSPY